MTVPDEIEDFIEHLVEDRGVKSILDLTRAEKHKLAYWVLIQNKMYVKLLKLMQGSINNYIMKTQAK